jgi:TPP-dependent pyruvate/acetoin dehydrogenase alpha subunit
MKNKTTKKNLIDFELKVKKYYENKEIKAPIHLSGNNEDHLIKIFKKIKREDWVFSSWRNHYHALLHGINPEWLFNEIIEGRSMGIINKKKKFYSSSIVGGILPIALGVALSLKKKKERNKVWVFIGDMTYECGIFHEVYKYSKNFKLPIKFVVEDNNLSTNTPTRIAWGKNSKILKDIIYYKYKRKYPHHGTGQWIMF